MTLAAARPVRAGRLPALPHLPALDGVRGVAVLAVVLFHAGQLPGGFLGVDVFFVLSGYLITALLLAEWRSTGRISLPRFWSRRARRLLPALLALVTVVGVAARPLLPPQCWPGLRGDALATLGYVANWRLAFTGSDYFDHAATASPLQHAWSLAIEEQFYLAWPLVAVVVLTRWRRPRLLLTVATAGALASALLMAVLAGGAPGAGGTNRLYYGTDTRCQDVLVGAALAALLAGRPGPSRGPAPRWVRPAVVLLASGTVAGLVLAAVTATGASGWLYRGGFLGTCLGTALVIAAVVLYPASWPSRVLSAAALRVLGKLSYGVYLWHWPVDLVLTGTRTGLRGLALLGLRMAVTLAVAAASYLLVEQPIRRGQVLAGWSATAAAPTAVAAAAAALLLVPTLPAGPTSVQVASTSAPARLTPPTPPPPRLGAAPATRAARPPGAPVRVMVVGDSMALTLAGGLPAADRASNTAVSNEATTGCGVAVGGPVRYYGGLQDQAQVDACTTWQARWAASVDRDDPDVALLLVGRWEVADRMWNGRWAHLGEPDFDAYIEAQPETGLRILTARGARVAVATLPYVQHGEQPDGGRWPSDDPGRTDRFNAMVRALVARHPDAAAVVELCDKVSPGGRFTPVVEGISTRFDGIHLTAEAAHWPAPLVVAAGGRARPASDRRWLGRAESGAVTRVDQ